MKYGLLILGVVGVAFSSLLSVPITNTRADSENYVAENYLMEISKETVKLPVPNVPNDWVYAITLKSGETILGENITEYLFTQTGAYTLVYRFHKNGSLTNILEETAVLTVADTQAPTIDVEDYSEEYFVGDTLTVSLARVTDNVDQELTAIVELYLDTEKLSIDDLKYTFTGTGNYRLVYSATDSSGNIGSIEYEFTVIERDSDGRDDIDQEGCNGCSGGISWGSSIIVMCTAVVGVLIAKRKDENN